jgi:hypothetical protein
MQASRARIGMRAAHRAEHRGARLLGKRPAHGDGPRLQAFRALRAVHARSSPGPVDISDPVNATARFLFTLPAWDARRSRVTSSCRGRRAGRRLLDDGAIPVSIHIHRRCNICSAATTLGAGAARHAKGERVFTLRIIRSVIATAAVFSLMAVAAGSALADSVQRCSQRGNFSGGDNDIKCFFDNGKSFADIDAKISRVLTITEIDVLNKNVVNVLSNSSGCNGLVVLLSCNKAVGDVVKLTLLSYNVNVITINVLTGKCGCKKKY